MTFAIFRGQPSVSVVMAVHNGMNYLPAAVSSILEQSFLNFEFLIVNDGSTDGSGPWLDETARSDSRVRVIHQQKLGLTRSLNSALAIARGALIARMDADDIALPDRLEKQVGYLVRHPDCVCVGSWATYIDEQGLPLLLRKMPRSHAAIDQGHLAGVGGLILHPSAMFRKASVEQVGGYDESYAYAQDLCLWLRLAEIGRLACIAEPLLKYRLHNDGISQKKKVEQMECVRSIVSSALQRRGIKTPVVFAPGPDILGFPYRPSGELSVIFNARGDGFAKTGAIYALRFLMKRPIAVGVYLQLVRNIAAMLVRREKVST